MKVLVLCSGGDAPGMNRFIYSFSRKLEGELFYAKEGFKGLVEGKIFRIDERNIEEAKDEAGTIVLTSRYPEFKEQKFFNKGVKNAKIFDYVIILGGNGSQQGAKRLSENKVNTIFVPATIDNDVLDSSYSIGFDSAVNQCVYVVNNTMPSIQSTLQTCFFEIMGNKSSLLTKTVSNIVNADYTICEEKDIDYKKIGKIIKENLKKEKATLIVIKEKIKNVYEIEKDLEDMGYYVWSQIVAKLQRGGKPTKKELQMADKFADSTIKVIKNDGYSKKILVDKNGKFQILGL